MPWNLRCSELLKPQAFTPHSIHIRELCSHHCSASNLCSTYISTGYEPGFPGKSELIITPVPNPQCTSEALLVAEANRLWKRSEVFYHLSIISECTAKARLMAEAIGPEKSEFSITSAYIRVHCWSPFDGWNNCQVSRESLWPKGSHIFTLWQY
jgi:hypothetical protein